MTAAAQVWRDARRGHAGLVWLATSMAALSVLLIGFTAFDGRTLLGAPVWLKPLKFAVSFTLYAGTLSWMLAQLRPGAFRWTGWVITAGSFIEMIVIVGRAARGVRSHFNNDTDLDALLYTRVMAISVAIIWLATLAIALRFLRADVGDRSTTVAVRFGLVVSLAGMAVGVIMSVRGGHAVGVPDGGPGLPLLGWSTAGGDLRVGHFVGMHALQIVPLAAAALAATGLPAGLRVRLVQIGGTAYAGLVALVTWQALRGQPPLAPDGWTLAVAAGLVLAVGAAGVAASLSRLSAPPPVHIGTRS